MMVFELPAAIRIIHNPFKYVPETWAILFVFLDRI